MNNDAAQLHSVNFIQDAKYVTVKHYAGITVYETAEVLDNDSALPQKPCGSINIVDARIVERPYNTRLVLIVSKNEPKALQVFNLSNRKTTVLTDFTMPILRVKADARRIVVCTKNRLKIYNLEDIQLIHSMQTAENRWGLLDIATMETRSMIAYPGSANSGTLNIFDATNLSPINTFPAHNGTLAAFKLNDDGTMVATASGKGTFIRVFNTHDGQKLFEFRRGVSRYVNISCLSFSEKSEYLCCSSDTETVHIFKVLRTVESIQAHIATWFSYMTVAAASYFPPQVNQIVTSEGSIATVRLPGQEKPTTAALTTFKEQPILLVGTDCGLLYCYEIDNGGGKCKLIKQQKIGPSTVVESHAQEK